MKIKIYENFQDIPLKQNLRKNLPVHGSENYARYLEKSKGMKILWFFGSQDTDQDYLITLTISSKGSFKKGKFITNVITSQSIEDLTEKKIFLDQVIGIIKKQSLCDWIGQGANWALFEVVPENATKAPFGTYRVMLEGKNEELLKKSFGRKVRQYINRGIKNEKLIVKKDHQLSKDSQNIINDVLEKGKLGKIEDKNAELLMSCMGENMLVYTAYLNDLPCASIVVFDNEFASYAAYSGRKYDVPQEVVPYLYWTIFKDSLSKSRKYFDFVGALVDPEPGTKAYNIQLFKSKYGEFKDGFLWKIVINERKYKVFDIFNWMRRLVRGFKGKRSRDIIDIERLRLGLE